MDPSLVSVPWTKIAAFARQHVHDLRNVVNSLELESSLLADSLPPEATEDASESVRMIRAQITRLEEQLRTIAGKFVLEPKPQPMSVAGDELLVCWREQSVKIKPAPAVEWGDPADGAGTTLSLDLNEVLVALRELLENAVAFGTSGPCRASVSQRDGQLILELREPKPAPVDPAGWGLEPFSSSRRQRHGLGLWQAKRAIAANGGTMAQSWDAAPGELVTLVSFPTTAAA